MDKQQELENLYEIILQLETMEDCKNFFADLCTYKELESLSQRAYAASLLINGHTYEDITKITNVSSATLSRINKCILHGSGGYTKQITKDKDKTN